MERDTAAARVIYLQLSGDKLRQWPSCRWHSTRTASTSCCVVYQEQRAVLQQMQQLDFGADATTRLWSATNGECAGFGW
jgi:hypothetical protein